MSVSTNSSLSGRCDGVTRRDFLRLGALSFLGLSLTDLLRLKAVAGSASASADSCILIWLDGGPSHLDMFDLKPDAPIEVRGEFKPIATAADGIQICEHLPRTAKMMREVALIRSLTHELGNHDTGSHYLLTGHKPVPSLDYPSLGSILARQNPSSSALPPYVAIPNAVHSAGAGYYPGAFAPFSVGGDPSKPSYKVRDLNPPEWLTLGRVDRRRSFQLQLDEFSKRVETNPLTESQDAYYQQAFSLLTSPQAKAAFDLEQEKRPTRDRYGRSRIGVSCLLARRLIEAGSRFVTVVDNGWDTHQQLFKNFPDAFFPGSGKLPALDQGYSALLDDLKQRGQLDRTLVILMGEFGRTPKINSLAGRDHWPRAGFVCLAGGGVKGGQVIGSTDAHGESPSTRPVRPEDLACTILRLLGVDVNHEYIAPSGRPLRVLSEGSFIHELV